jgi:glucarate dehydratase
VNLPLVAPYRWVAGVNHGFTKVVVEVATTDGIVGLGEAASWRHARLIDEELAPRLIGLQVADLRECWRAAVPPVQTLHNIESDDVIRAYGAIEMALWDALGKLAEAPLYRLLGGAARTRVPFTEYFAARDRRGTLGGEESPADIAAYCARMVDEHGSPHFEGKVGYKDLETDVAIAREVREAIGPTRSLRLDANMGWTLATAREALRRIADLGVVNVEDPVAGLEAMAKLRSHSTIAFSTHSSNLRSAVRLGVPDSFVLNLTALGGIERTIRFIGACEAMGIRFSFYSGETGIGTAAYLHVAAADSYLSTPSQSLLRWYTTDVVLGGPFRPQEGYLDVPSGPGLGVEIDRDALKKAHDDFVEGGPLQEAAKDPRIGGYSQPPLY